ncbi:PIN domain-containing protein [Mucilaginibacter sp. CSA2-8R]|uniref:PIN domain-containing protein n=1 Tax=Mucilaginibacter sp. CSA2-8R TaxID=3141542 RepID=UPI00315C89F9
MHIFLDTNAVKEDPLWRHNFPSALLSELKKNDKFHLYISDVVIAEINKNYELDASEALTIASKAAKSLQGSVRGLNKFLKEELKISVTEINPELGDLNYFYDALFKFPNFHLIETSNETLQTVLGWVKLYKPPYFTKTQPGQKKPFEYKDAVIWQSYKTYCLLNGIKEAHILTNNISDFLTEEETQAKKTGEPSDLNNGYFIDGVSYHFHSKIQDFIELYPQIFVTQLKEQPEWLNTIIADKNGGLLGRFAHGYNHVLRSFVRHFYQSGLHSKIIGNISFGFFEISLKVIHNQFEIVYGNTPRITAFNEYAIISYDCKGKYYATIEITQHRVVDREGSSEPIVKYQSLERQFSLSFIISKDSDVTNVEVTLDDGISRDLTYPYNLPNIESPLVE